jgi:uncharacterized protein (DUF1015 family)
MVLIAPFRGYVYDRDEIASHGSLLTSPPYDVLTPADRDRYLDGHPHNFLQVDFGRVLPEDPDHMAWHARSAVVLEGWLRERVLVRSPAPSVYMSETEFTHPLTGRRTVRRGFLCLMRLEPPGKDSSIRLHEKTFSFHKQERLDLMEKTRAQLSPIFGFVPDSGGELLEDVSAWTKGDPDILLKDPAGGAHKVVELSDREALFALCSKLASKTVYIADGHHRFMTSLAYREKTRAQLTAEGRNPPEGSAVDWVMTYLCPMSDPGLCVLPTHRILRSLPFANDEILERLGAYADIRVFPFSDSGRRGALDSLSKKLLEDRRKGLTVFGVYLNGCDCCCFVKIREKVKEAVAEAAPERAPLSLLDVSILTDTVFGKALGLTEENLDDPECISFTSDSEEAFRLVDEGERAAFILNPTSLDEILKVTESGYVMPRKATYFYPKVQSGLVINLVDPDEIPGQ